MSTLKEYRKVCVKIARLEKRMEDMRDVSIKSTSDMRNIPSGNRQGSRTEDVVCKLTELSEELQGLYKDKQRLTDEIYSAMEVLNDTEYEVCRRRWLEFMTVEKTAEDTNYSLVHVYRALRSANKKCGYEKCGADWCRL